MTARTMSLSKDLGMARTKPMYLPLTSELNEYANKLAQREDLIIRVLAKTGGAPARFIPASATLDLNESLLIGADPKTVGTATFCQEHPTAAGALGHECAHAWQTAPWMLHPVYGTHSDLAKHQRSTLSTIFLLEEGRIEVQALKYTWDAATTAAVKIMIPSVVLKDFHSNPLEGEEPKSKVIRLWGLMAARITSGLLVNPAGVQEKAERVLGAPALADGTAIANQFAAIHIYGDNDTANMQELWRVAAEWQRWAEGQKDTGGGSGEDTTCPPGTKSDDEQSGDSGDGDEQQSGEDEQSGDSGDEQSGEDEGNDGDSGDGDSDGGESGDQSSEGDGESGDSDGDGGESGEDEGDGGEGKGDKSEGDSADDSGSSDSDEQANEQGDDSAGEFDSSKGPDDSLTPEQIEQILEQITDKIGESISEAIDRESKAINQMVQEAERSANEFRLIRRKAESEAAEKIRVLRRQRMVKGRR